MSQHPLIIILEDIRSALNVGAIFRTADGIGASQLFLVGITPYPPHNRIPKTALGAIDFVSWKHFASISAALSTLPASYEIIGAELTPDAQLYTEYHYAHPTALIMGNEISGLSATAQSKCHTLVKIPMFGQKESLNVATSCGIISYEIIRQFNLNSKQQ